ncbi:MAG: cell division protein FtsA [Bacteroidaceae bacterium]|nr:cell division protein FtsA [Bacteroidaceae bacterium]
MSEYIVAIELGSSKIVGIAGYRDENGMLVVSAIEKENATNIIKRGCVQNVDEVFSCIKRIKMKLENRLAPAKIVKTYIGVGGASVSAEEKVTNRSFHEDSIIKQAHVQKLKEECRAMLPSTIDTLDIVPTGYIIDGRAERNAIGVTGTTIEAHYKAITAKPVLKRNIDRCVIERLKLPIAGYITSALATADVVLSKDERMLGCMLVDFGAETTTVSIYKNDTLVLLETLPMGGRNITRDIMSLNLVSTEAEHLKIASGMAKGFKSENNVRLKFEGDNMVEIDLAKLTSVVEARSEEIIANVEEQIKRSGLERKELTAGVVVVGNAAKLRGWLELLEERLGGMKVRVGALRKDIQAVEKERSQVNDYMQAVGLLYAAKEDCTKTPFQEKPVEPEKPVIEEEEEEEIVITVDKEPAEEKKPKRKNIFTALFDKFGQMIEEGENDDEE